MRSTSPKKPSAQVQKLKKQLLSYFVVFSFITYAIHELLYNPSAIDSSTNRSSYQTSPTPKALSLSTRNLLQSFNILPLSSLPASATPIASGYSDGQYLG